ncbi:MAG: CHAT domain-containing protein [Cyanobacteria bacterium J06555_13]
MANKKKILILAANPKNSSFLRLGEEVRDIEAGMERSKFREEFEVAVPKLALRSQDLRRALLDHTPTIVHFAGQGAGANGLLIEDDDGSSKLVSNESLARLFSFFKNCVECVVLNACYSEEQAKLFREHIDYVVGIEGEITNRQAIEFATSFYDALGAGESYKRAEEFGKDVVLNLKEESDRKKRKNFRNVLLANLGIGALLVISRFLGAFQTYELSTYDLLMKLSPIRPKDERIAIIAIKPSKLVEEKLYGDKLDTETPDRITDYKLIKVLEYLESHHKDRNGQLGIIGLDVFRDTPHDEPGGSLYRQLDSKSYTDVRKKMIDENKKIISVCHRPDSVKANPTGIKPVVEDGKNAIHGFSNFYYEGENSSQIVRLQTLSVSVEESAERLLYITF